MQIYESNVTYHIWTVDALLLTANALKIRPATASITVALTLFADCDQRLASKVGHAVTTMIVLWCYSETNRS